MSGVQNGTRDEQLASLRRRTHQEIQSLHRIHLTSPERADPARLARLLDLRDQLDDALGQAREPRPKRRTRRAPTPHKAEQLLEALGITAADVRRWALNEGLAVGGRGRLGYPLVHAWAEAHGRA